MSREVVSRVDALRLTAAKADRLGGTLPPAETIKPDDYVDRLAKYIPPDVIAAFITIESAIGAAKDPPGALAWIVFAVILIATPFYLWKFGNVRKPLQLAISTIAFVVWAFAYPGLPFSSLHIESSIYGAVALGLFSFLVPLVEV